MDDIYLQRIADLESENEKLRIQLRKSIQMVSQLSDELEKRMKQTIDKFEDQFMGSDC